jgi:hypothetical protein
MNSLVHRVRRALVGSAAAVALLAAACTGGGDAVGPTVTSGSTYHPTGHIVILAGQFLTGLRLLDVATDREREFHLPLRGGAYTTVWPARGGRFYALPTLGLFSTRSTSQLFVIGGDRPERVGPTTTNVTDFEVRGNYVLTWGCPGVMQLLDLTHPNAWRTIGHACVGSISPDGRRLAYVSPTGLFVMRLPDGPSRRVLRFRDVPELRPAHVVPQSLDSVEWGKPGIAVAVGDSSRSAIVVWRENGRPVVDPLGTAQFAEMQWQPGGRLLAFLELLPNGEAFTFDPDTGVERQIGISRDSDRMAWSPDGKVLAIARSLNVVALIDTEGRQVGTLTSSGVPLLWVPS